MEHKATGSSRSAVRGLATLAMLKTNFDRGRDHLSMFEPFVVDTLATMALDGADAVKIQAAVLQRHELNLPPAAVRTLLSRATKKHLIRREGGRYFDNDGALNGQKDLQQLRQEVEARQAVLAEALRSHAHALGVVIESNADSLAMILRFIDDHHVRLALEGFEDSTIGVTRIDGDSDETTNKPKLVASFLAKVILEHGELSDVVEEMLEGFILQNTLLLSDISAAERPFSRLRVFFDSTLLFSALGLDGPGTELVTTEVLSMLRERGATTEVFTTTVREMRRIFAVYESKLGTEAGRKSLYPTALTRHLLTVQATPADVRTISALLEGSLADLGFRLSDAPKHIAALTLDETDLGARLADRLGSDASPRVVHDIDCVAGVLTLRGGDEHESLDQSRAVFVSLSAMTVRHVIDWYKTQGGSGFPPMIHFLLLSNLAWLKKPGSAAKLKLDELVALCAAALRPSRRVWDAFLRHLDKLESSGVISSDESAAILASNLTDRYLAEEEFDDDPDAETFSEVVRRVRSEYQEASERELGSVRAELASAQHQAAHVTTRVQARGAQVGSLVSWIFAAILAASFAFGTGVTVFNVASGKPVLFAFIALGVIPLVLAALAGLLWGFNLKSWRQKVALGVARAFAHWIGSDES